MRTYKEKLEGIIEDFNSILSDRMMFPEYKGGEFKLEIGDKTEDEVTVLISFKEGDESWYILRRDGVKNDDKFYGYCYGIFLRQMLFSVDSVGELKDPSTDHYINFLTISTLADSGLDKIREWKKSNK